MCRLNSLYQNGCLHSRARCLYFSKLKKTKKLLTRSFLCVSFVFVHLQPSSVNCLSHSFHVCLQMHDIVKAVGNCSYNQLVEKIISCKQSDNSELAGEGECPIIFLSFLPEQRVSLKSSSVSPGVFDTSSRGASENKTRTNMWLLIK